MISYVKKFVPIRPTNPTLSARRGGALPKFVRRIKSRALRAGLLAAIAALLAGGGCDDGNVSVHVTQSYADVSTAAIDGGADGR